MEVKELVEWTAGLCLSAMVNPKKCQELNQEKVCYPYDAEKCMKCLVKIILSHPDLYLRDKGLYECPECGQGNIIPLAEAIKELE